MIGGEGSFGATFCVNNTQNASPSRRVPGVQKNA